MAIIVVKAEGFGLFDKLVPIKGSVSKEGTVTAPHYAKRKVKLAEVAGQKSPKKAKPEPEHAVSDLFAELPAEKQKAPEAKAPEPAEKPEPKEERAAEPADQTETRDTPEARDLPVSRPGMDYSKPFSELAIPEFGVAAGTSKEERRVINARARELVQHRDVRSGLDADELATLRQYSGNGGCGDSLNEFYTDPKVAAAMWFALRGMLKGETFTALEPSCATGVFLATAPQGVSVVGVEMDDISARIGKVLNPAHEVQTSSLEGFATTDARRFDVVIGNAPFGLRGALIKDDKSERKTAEGYFIDTALDKLKPGGIVAMIVPTGVMDSARDRKLRETLLRKGQFLGALRMPNTAFEHSHTGVTTDVVFFQRRADDVAGALQAVDQAMLKKLGVWDDEFLSGSYFTGRGAHNILGTMTDGWRAKAGMGDDITVEGSMVGVPESIADFTAETPEASNPNVAAILAAAPDDEARARIRGGAMRLPYDTARRGDTKIVDGVEYILEGEPLRWHRVDEVMQTPAVTDAADLAADIERAIAGEPVADLADRVKAYVEKHGNPAKNENLLLAASRDKLLYRLIGAVKPDGSLSDVVTGRKAAVESSFDAAAQSVALEIGWFKPEAVAARWAGGDSETVLDHLYASPDFAIDPVSGLWTSLDQYLSGELWPKLDEAKAAIAKGELKPEDRAKVERQARALEETIDPKSLEDVEVMLNSAFLPLNVIAAFFNDHKNSDDASEWEKKTADLEITFANGVYTLKGGSQTGLLEKYLNRTGVRKDDLPTIERMNKEFKEWLCGSRFREEVETLYNRKFRGFRQRAYSDKPFEIPGLVANGLKSYQYSGIRWALEAGKGIVAADVGLGKTARGLILARLAKVNGLAKRPILVVPKSVLANWVEEAEKWFPGSNVLTIGETYSRDKNGRLKGKEDTAAERARKLHDLRQNEYDFILISQPAWNDIDLDPETKSKYVESDFWVQRGESLGQAGTKRLNKIRESYNQSVAGREFKKRTDVIYFNDLGIDMIIGDEMHAYKNLYAAKNRFGAQPKFLGGQGLSNRALDMNLKARWVRDNNGGKNIYGLTATPTKNSPLEIYSMLSHIAPEAFENIGVRNSEEFLDRFCEFKSENILTTTGNIEEALVTVGFKNLDELRGIMRRYIDRKTADDVGLALPKRDDRQHLVDMSPEQNKVYEVLREAAANVKKDGKGDAHIFSIMDKMGKAAMDLELLDSSYKGAKSPKYESAAEQIAAGVGDGGQVVFADNIGVHEKMRDALVARGIQRDQIAIINAQVAASSSARQNIANDFNAGKLRVVIGNTATMGEGINLQKGTTDIHHLDLPWEPASMQQRNGRGLRQGNISEAVRIHTYLAKGSFDGYRYQSMMAKKDWQDLLWNGGDRVENLAREGAVSRDDLLVMLSADPEAAREKMAANKAEAQKRFEAQKRAEAVGEFTRFQEMSRSYSSLKNKESAAANRLKVNISRARDRLEQDKYFKGKSALDAKTPVLLNPATTEPLVDGFAFEVPAGGKVDPGKYIITKVNPLGGYVQARRYGHASGAPISFDVDDLARATPAEYDAEAERKEISQAMAVDAATKVSSIASYKDLRDMPPEIVQQHYDNIQRQAREGLKEYKFNPGYGNVGMVSPEGKAVAASSYDARKMAETHHLMLPTAEHREKAMEAYAADEMAKEFGREAPPTSKRRRSSYGSSETKDVIRWPGDYGNNGHQNRWASIGREVFGDNFEKEAATRFHQKQYEAARRAKTLPDAISALSKTSTGGYGTMGAWSKRALATLWAKAKHEKKLDTTLDDELPRKNEYGYDRRILPEAAFQVPSGYGMQASKPVTKLPMRDALIEMATARGYDDLATAMVVSSERVPEVAAKKLIEIGNLDFKNRDKPKPAVVNALRHLVEKKPDLGSLSMFDLGWRAFQGGDMTLSDYIDRAASGTVREGILNAA